MSQLSCAPWLPALVVAAVLVLGCQGRDRRGRLPSSGSDAGSVAGDAASEPGDDASVDDDAATVGECDYGEVRGEGGCRAVPVLSVTVSDTTDPVAEGPVQHLFAASLEPVRPEIIDPREVRASEGPCRIYTRVVGVPVQPVHEPFCGDWGTVTLDGTTSVSLPYACDDGRGHSMETVSVFTPGSTVRVAGSGGSAFGAFDANLVLLARSRGLISGTVARGATLSVSWDGPAPNRSLFVVLTAIGTEGEVEHIWCDLPLDATSVTIGPALTNLLPASIENATGQITKSTRTHLEIDDGRAAVELSSITTDILRL